MARNTFPPSSVPFPREGKLIIAGTRQFDDWPLLATICNEMREVMGITTVLSGANPGLRSKDGNVLCRGADALGEHWATVHGIPVKRFPADWNKYGLAAGPIRNGDMAREGDALLVFWDGESRGTYNMLREMLERQKPYRVIFYLHEQEARRHRDGDS